MAGTRGKGSRSRIGRNSGRDATTFAVSKVQTMPVLSTGSHATETHASETHATETHITESQAPTDTETQTDVGENLGHGNETHASETHATESQATRDTETQTDVRENLGDGLSVQETRRRGMYLRKNAPTKNGEKKVIHIDGLNYLDPEVPRSITKEYKGSFSGNKTEWHLLDKTLVEHMYKKFQDLYLYEEGVNPEWARHVWEEKSKTLCRQTWSLVRKQCKKQSNSTNPVDWKPFRPCFVHEKDWEGIIESWLDPKWQKLSENGSKNRKRVCAEDGDDSIVSHTGGSVNFAVHLRRMESELGHTPNKLDFFAKMHKKNKGKGEWCDRKAEKVAQKYEEKMKEKLQDDGIEQPSADQPSDGIEQLEIPFDPKVWLEVTGVSKNKQVYGQCKSTEFESLIGKAATPIHSQQKGPQNFTPLNIEEQIEQEVAARVASHVDSLRLEMEEKMQAERSEMNAKEERLRAEMEEKMRQMLESYRRS